MSSGTRLSRKRLAPRWLTEEEGELVGYSLDLVKDAQLEAYRLGLLARFPEQGPRGTPAPDDALAEMGRDRRVVRGINETAASYVRRLKVWLDDRKRCGNPFALMQKLAEYTGAGPAFRTVDARGNWFSRDADGTQTALIDEGNWNWDDDPYDGGGNLRWSRFWVIIYPNGLWTEQADYGDGEVWGGVAGTWGSTAPAYQVDTIRGIVADWKPAGTRCINIILAFDPASFDPLAPEPDGLWEHWSKNVAGVQVPARLSTARYWDGVI